MAAVDLQFAHMNDAEGFIGMKAAPVSTSAIAADHVLVSGVASKRIYCYRIELVINADTTITFKDGPSTSLSGPKSMRAYGSHVLDLSNLPWYQTSAGNDLILSSTGSAQIGGTIYYVQAN